MQEIFMCNMTRSSFALLCTFLFFSTSFWSEMVGSSSARSSQSAPSVCLRSTLKVSSLAKAVVNKSAVAQGRAPQTIASAVTPAAASSSSSLSIAQPVAAPLLHERIGHANSLKEKMAIIGAAHDDEAALSLLTLPKDVAKELMNNRIASYVNNDSPMVQLHRQYFAQQRRLGHEEWAMRGDRPFEHNDKRKKALRLQDRAHAAKFNKDRESLLRQDPNNWLVMHSAMADRSTIFEIFASCLHMQHEEEKAQWQQREKTLLAEIEHLRSSNEKLQSGVLLKTASGSRSKSVKKGAGTK